MAGGEFRLEFRSLRRWPFIPSPGEWRYRVGGGSRSTVNNHIQHILHKLDSHTRLQAIRRAENARLIGMHLRTHSLVGKFMDEVFAEVSV